MSSRIYQPKKENGANRKIDKNNFHDILKAFSRLFLYRLKINKLQRLSKIIEKKLFKVLPYRKKVVNLHPDTNQLKQHDNDLHDINNQPRF